MKRKLKQMIAKMPGIRSVVDKVNGLQKKNDVLCKQNEQLQKKIEKIQQQLDENSQEMENICYANVLADLSYIQKIQDERSGNGVDAHSKLVSVIILNRNGKDKLEILLNSLKKCKVNTKYEIILVDNASTDDSVPYIKSQKQDMPIELICNQKNLSFSAANNLAARRAKGEYLLFLNNDTEVTEGWLDELLFAMHTVENPGAIGAKLVYPKIPEGNVNSNKSYRVQHNGIAFQDTIREKSYFVKPYNMGNGTALVEHNAMPIERACVTAAVLLVSKEAFFSVDGFDEHYLYGYEDVDFCLKLLKAGYRNYYCPTSFVYHYEFGTQSKDDKKEVRIRRRHNMEVFKGKWQSYLSRKLLEDKLESRHLFTEQRLVLGVVITEGQKETTDDRKLLAQLNAFCEDKGYDVKYLCTEDESSWYDVGIEVDVLVVMTDAYKVSDIYNTKDDLIRIAWVSKFDVTKQEELSQYDFTLTESDPVEKLTNLLLEYNKDIVDEHMIDICGAMPDNDTKKFWGDQHFAVSMKKYFERLGYRANVVSRDEWYKKSKAKYIIVLRGTKAYYPSQNDGRVYLMWNISHPENISAEEYNLYDYVFFASAKLKEEVGSRITPKSSVLLQCVDEEVMTFEETEKKEYELLFVGNSRRVYRQILKDLLPTQHNLSVFGRHWEEFPVQQYVVKDYIENEKLGQAYHDAKILLNDHWDDMKEYGIISNRIFDALAVGAFVISDYLPEIKEEFGEAVVTYQTKEELREKIDYYLKNDKERQCIALKGRAIVLEKHTFAIRCDEIVKVMESFG